MSALLVSGTCPNENITFIVDQLPVNPPSHATLVVWLFFFISASQLLLPILVLALFSSKPRAEPTLINLGLTWIIGGVVSSILLYSGHAVGCEPPPMLCLTQASLYTALPPMGSVAVFTAVLQIFFNVRQKLQLSIKDQDHSVRRVCLLVMPYVIYALFATTAAAFASPTFESTVSRTRRYFYCSIKSGFLANVVIGFCSIVGIITWAFAIQIAVMLYQNWMKLHKSADNRLDFSYIFRMLGFHTFFSIALLLALLPKHVLTVSDMAMAITGYVVVVTFGTRKTVLQACLTSLNCFYRRNEGVTNKAAEKMQMVV